MDLFSTAAEKMPFRVVVPEKTTSYVLDSRMLMLLVSLNESKNIAKISQETGISGSDLSKSLHKLIEMGIVEPIFKEENSKTKYMGPEFIESLVGIFSESVGPMGSMLVSEVLEELEIPEENIPSVQAAEIVNVLATQIPGEQQKLRFQKEMLDLLRKS